jgi:phosphopantothenoylcysteine synthetase/decarboxylase
MKSSQLHFLITTGGTREYIDPVRFISNASSGKMGYALADAAIKAGHKVTLISAPTFLKPPKKTKVIEVVNADEMFKAVKRNFNKYSCLIMAAAVSDYKPAKVSKTKIRKSDKDLIIKLKPTVDILKWAGKNKKKNQIIIGFALEDRNLRKNAEKKLKDKNLDMIIANAPDAIGAEKSTAWIKQKNNRWLKLPKADKSVIAKRIIRLIENF